MSSRYRSRYSARKLARRSRRNLIITLCLVVLILYATLVWILPSLINGVGFIKDTLNPSPKNTTKLSDNSFLAPPVLNIPYEATNSSQIDIKGYSTPNSKVKLYLDDQSKDTVDVNGEGSFTFQNVDLNLGTNNIYAKTIDDKNTESLPSKTIKVIFDNEKPSLTISEPEDNKKIQGGDKKVKVAGKTDPSAQVFINGTQIILDKDGNFSSDQPLNEGDNSITIKALSLTSNTTELQRRVTYTP